MNSVNNRLKTALSKAREKTALNPLGLGLITYLMAGDPDPATTLRRILGLAQAGVDILELGVPFSDPIADGPVIQAAGQRALKQRMDLEQLFQIVEQFRQANQTTPILLMSYLNPILSYGYDRFLKEAKEAGVDGFILPDLPWRENYPFRQRAEELFPHHFAFIPMIAQTSAPSHIAEIAREEKGFAYILSRNGITGGEAEIPDSVLQFLQSLQSALSLPCYIGFGIRSSAQIAKLKDFSQGVIIGSALVQKFADLDTQALPHQELLKQEKAIYTWIRELRNIQV